MGQECFFFTGCTEEWGADRCKGDGIVGSTTEEGEGGSGGFEVGMHDKKPDEGTASWGEDYVPPPAPTAPTPSSALFALDADNNYRGASWPDAMLSCDASARCRTGTECRWPDQCYAAMGCDREIVRLLTELRVTMRGANRVMTWDDSS